MRSTDVRRGICKTDGAPEDARALRETLEIVRQMPLPAPEPTAPLPVGIAPNEAEVPWAAIDEAVAERERHEAALQGGLMLSDVADMWLTERTLKNTPRMVNVKRLHLEDFRCRIGTAEPNDVPINMLRKSVLVGCKAALRAERQTGKTADNKLLTLHDFFKYAINNGHYTASDLNPVAGLFVLSKCEWLAKARSCEPITPDDMRAVFESAGFKTWASAPDLWFPPLMALFTGLRISEATRIAPADVKLADNGVHYISITDGKTAAGVRNVPVCDAPIRLGVLRYVDEVRAVGHDRLYLHRPFVKPSWAH
ncbi:MULTISPECIES: hypothetical protein [Burkholderia]|uniref:hypothetical protein n=1 Tax=Burkholderia TaxID=32008 RepID=UPI001269F651|nr:MULTISPECIES: hypothetical protein [Burkholderia]